MTQKSVKKEQMIVSRTAEWQNQAKMMHYSKAENNSKGICMFGKNIVEIYCLPVNLEKKPTFQVSLKLLIC